MKVTFPHIGNIYIAVKALFDDTKIEYIIPPKSSKKTLEIGTRLAPEMACLPLKINIGNFIESINLGADTIFITGGWGPCRFGYYGEMHKEILKDLGYHIQFITLEPNEKGIGDLIKNTKILFNNKKLITLVAPIIKSYNILKDVDKLEKFSYYVRAREIKRNSTDKVMNNFQNNIKKYFGSKEIKKYIHFTRKELQKIEINKSKKPLKIGIVGEIYTLIEPLTNINIDRILGNMGIEIDFSLTLSEWIMEHIVKGALPIKKKDNFIVEAKPYLKEMIGGHARETIGNTILYAKNGFDGVIEIYPLTCMPEIVATSILPKVSQDYNFHVLTLIMDEITGIAGYQTRIEAFIDMLLRKKSKKEKKTNEFILSRY